MRYMNASVANCAISTGIIKISVPTSVPYVK